MIIIPSIRREIVNAYAEQCQGRILGLEQRIEYLLYLHTWTHARSTPPRTDSARSSSRQYATQQCDKHDHVPRSTGVSYKQYFPIQYGVPEENARKVSWKQSWYSGRV